MATPLFSILIANYNNGIYLEEAIHSVFAQTYTNWEIILVDDGSTDNSKEIYKNYSNDSRIHIYYNEKNNGCGYTKHRCADLANGKICGFLDPDDALEKTALELTVKEHLRFTNASLIYTKHYVCDKNLKIQNEGCSHAIPKNLSYLEYGHGAISHFATFKKNLYNKTEGINNNFKKAIDQDLYLKLEEVGQIVFIPSILYYYRTNTGINISLGKDNKAVTLWHIIALIDTCKRRQLSIEDIIMPYYETFINFFNQKELNDVYSSFSFKLGKFITKPFHWIIKKIK